MLELHAQCVGEAFDGMLGGRIHGLIGDGLVRSDRAKVDDRTGVAIAALIYQVACRLQRTIHDAPVSRVK